MGCFHWTFDVRNKNKQICLPYNLFECKLGLYNWVRISARCIVDIFDWSAYVLSPSLQAGCRVQRKIDMDKKFT